jgi:hypothetical protein
MMAFFFIVPSEMHNIDLTPFLFQILRNQEPVTVMRTIFTAKKAGVIEVSGTKELLNLPFPDELHKSSGVVIPILIGPIGFQDFLTRGQFRAMPVGYAAEGIEKKREIISLGKSRELRGIVKPDIEHGPHSVF